MPSAVCVWGCGVVVCRVRWCVGWCGRGGGCACVVVRGAGVCVCACVCGVVWGTAFTVQPQRYKPMCR